MFHLYATKNNGFTNADAAPFPLRAARGPLREWLRGDGSEPLLLISSREADRLRKLRNGLAFHGLQTRVTSSRLGRRTGHVEDRPDEGFTPALIGVVDREPTPPPIAIDSFRADMERMRAERSGSGLIRPVHGKNSALTWTLAAVALVGSVLSLVV